MMKALAIRMAKTKYATKAIEERADLKSIKKNLTFRNYVGIFLMAFSYLLGPALLGAAASISYYLEEPRIIVFGGVASFVFAHIVFFLGMYLAGGKYLGAVLRWLTRVVLEKLSGGDPLHRS